jgi:WD40 repeat protein
LGATGFVEISSGGQLRRRGEARPFGSGGPETPQAIALSQNGNIIAAFGGHTLYTWEAKTGNRLAVMSLPAHDVEGALLGVSDFGRVLVAGIVGSSQRVFICDLATRSVRELMSAQSLTASLVAIAAQANRTAHSDTLAVRVTDLDSGHSWPVLTRNSTALTQIALSSSGELLAVGSIDGRVMIVRLSTQEEVLLPGHEQAITAMAFSHDERLLATGSSDTSVLVWDLESRTSEMQEGSRQHASTLRRAR